MSDAPSLRESESDELRRLRKEHAAMVRILRRVWRAVWTGGREDPEEALLAGLKSAKFAHARPDGGGTKWSLNLPAQCPGRLDTPNLLTQPTDPRGDVTTGKSE